MGDDEYLADHFRHRQQMLERRARDNNALWWSLIWIAALLLSYTLVLLAALALLRALWS